MGQALYRKYRSKSLKEIVGQEHITTTLENALKSGRISHAYLFTGPRGVGKTSIARILAHEINQLPYDEEQPHIDIIEIDAASNRRIDEIRDLRDKVHIAPASAKYKVYIIDEVHMLTREAFNALLKTLEEPPAHVIFILATTEAHKLPETIVSRTQRYIFRPIETKKAVAHLKDIAKQEKLKVSDDALELIAQHGGGSFRDSISLLDQAGAGGEEISLAAVQRMLGIPPQEALESLLQSLQSGAAAHELVKQLNQLYEQGYQASAIATQLAQLVRAQIISGTITAGAMTDLLAKLLDVPTAHDPERFLEIVLMQASTPATNPSPKVQVVTAVKIEETPPSNTAKVAPSKHQKAEVTATATPDEPVVATVTVQKPVALAKGAPLDDETWQKVLDILKKQYNTLYGVVRMAQPTMTDDELQLTFAFAFHQKRANESKNQRVIREAVHEVTGRTVTITCLHDPNLKLAKKSASTTTTSDTTRPDLPTGEPLAAISNIFGSAEVLE